MTAEGRLWNRDFTALWAGQVASQLGSQAAHVAIALWTVEATGSARLMGLTLALSSALVVLLGPLGGAMADRHSRRGLIVAADVVRGLAALGLGLLLPWAPIEASAVALVACSLLSGAMAAAFLPAVSALIPSVVPQGRLAAANALSQSSGQVCALVGLAFGGIAYLRWGAPALLVADGLSFLGAAAATAFVREPARPSAPPHASGTLRAHLTAIAEGWRWIAARTGLRTLLVALGAANLLFMPVYVLLPLYVRDHLRAGDEWYGLLLASAASGALVGLASVGFRKPAAATAAPLLLAGLATGALSLTTSAPLAAALLALVGSASSRFNVLVVTDLQASAPEALRGRVMALVVTLAAAAAPLGLLLGSLAGGASADVFLPVIAGCGAGMSAAAAWSLRRGGQ